MDFDSVLLKVLDDFIDGKKVDVEGYCKKYPEHRQKLLSKLKTADFIKRNLQEEDLSGRKFGEYIILQELGRGGMGIVFLAIQPSLSRLVTIKTLPSSFVCDKEALKNFQEEARIIAKFNHPNIIPIYSFGTEQKINYIAMGYVSGPSIKNMIERLKIVKALNRIKASTIRDMVQTAPFEEKDISQKSITLKRGFTFWNQTYFQFVATIGKEIAEAMSYAHQNGIFHGDLKPSNILLTNEAIPLVVDFGLSKDIKKIAHSKSKEFSGTLAYAAPEQIKENLINEKTDVWAMGVTLYELLTLNKPFMDKDVKGIVDKILDQDPPFLRSFNKKIPIELEAIVFKCLDKKPENRYSSASELSQDLRNYLDEKLIRAKPIGPIKRLHKKAKRHPILTIAIFITSIAIIGSPLFMYNRYVNSMILLGGAFKENGDYLAAIGAYSKVLDLLPNTPLTREKRALVLTGLYLSSLSMDKKEAMLVYLEMYIKLKPKDLHALSMLGNGYGLLGCANDGNPQYHSMSLKYGKKMLFLDPYNIDGILIYSRALMNLGQAEEAIEFLLEKCKTDVVARDLRVQEDIYIIAKRLSEEFPEKQPSVKEVKKIIVSQGFDSEYAESIAETYLTFKVKKFEDLKFSIACPTHWNIRRITGIMDNIPGTKGVVGVMLPSDSAHNGFTSNMIIYVVSNGPSAPNDVNIIMGDIETYNKELNKMSNSPMYPNFTLLESKKIKVGKYEAYRGIFTYSHLNLNIVLKASQICILGEGVVYGLTYTAASETYDKYVDKFYKVLDSFTILEQEKLYDDQF